MLYAVAWRGSVMRGPRLPFPCALLWSGMEGGGKDCSAVAWRAVERAGVWGGAVEGGGGRWRVVGGGG
jgi:hypothetical protein